MILLVYSMRCCRTWGQTTDRKKAGWKFCSSPFRKCGHDFGDSSFPVANFVGTGKKILRRKSEKRAACESAVKWQTVPVPKKQRLVRNRLLVENCLPIYRMIKNCKNRKK